MLGVMPTRDAQRLADQRGLDLVEITPTAVPPVCKATVKSSVAAGDGSLLWLAVMAILAMAGVCRMGFARKKLDN